MTDLREFPVFLAMLLQKSPFLNNIFGDMIRTKSLVAVHSPLRSWGFFNYNGHLLPQIGKNLLALTATLMLKITGTSSPRNYAKIVSGIIFKVLLQTL